MDQPVAGTRALGMAALTARLDNRESSRLVADTTQRSEGSRFLPGADRTPPAPSPGVTDVSGRHQNVYSLLVSQFGGRSITQERSDRPDAAICVETQDGQACTVRSATEPMLYSGADGRGGTLLVVVDPQRRLDGVDIADAAGTRRVRSLDGGLSVIATADGAARSANAIGREGEVLATFDTGRLESHRKQAQDAINEQPDH